MMRTGLGLCALVLLCTAGAGAPREAARREAAPLPVGPGRSIQFVAARGQVWAAWSSSVPGGQDLLFARVDPAASAGPALGRPVRVNEIAGELRDTNENSPLLLKAPDDSALYLIWVGAQPEHTLANRLRFSRFDLAAQRWSPALVINDDLVRATHSFQGAAVNARGAIDVAWLDRRHNDRGGAADYPGGGDQRQYREIEAALYTSRSVDGGRTFGANRRIDAGACACCRAAVAAVGDETIVAWRKVAAGSVRDIVTSRSTDGVRWSAPATVWRDGWVIEGCPHEGPAMLAIGGRLHIAWMTGQSGEAVLAVARSDDGGRTFGDRRVVSGGVAGPGGAVLIALRDRVALAFHGSSGARRPAILYRTLPADGRGEPTAVETLSRSADGRSALYPSLLTHAGRRIVGWVERTGERSLVYVSVSPMPQIP